MSNSKEYNARYWEKHKEEITEKRKKKYKEDAEYREKAMQRNKKWIENNRDKWNAYMNKRRKKAKTIDETKNI